MFLPPGCRAVLRPAFGSLRALSAGSPIASYDARVTGIDDGSESLLGQAGHYKGPWDPEKRRPHGGVGVLVWDNGISYEGEWRDGRFDGQGAKLYSRGGGYRGAWVAGKRQGAGVQLFGGKFGYDQWAGPFVRDRPHGVGTMRFADGSEGEFEFENGKPKASAGGAAKTFEGRLDALDDGSPSTVGIPGEYSGGWDDAAGLPHGYGRMQWDNGIEYKGMWARGVYHGHGRKLYSRGGGYEGAWARGKRAGHGITFFDETHAHGVLRWEGPFVDDKPHGIGQAYVRAERDDEHGRWVGDTAVKGPLLEFVEGKPVNWPGTP